MRKHQIRWEPCGTDRKLASWVKERKGARAGCVVCLRKGSSSIEVKMGGTETKGKLHVRIPRATGLPDGTKAMLRVFMVGWEKALWGWLDVWTDQDRSLT